MVCHERRKILTSALSTSLKRSSFLPFPGMDLGMDRISSNDLLALHSLFQDVPIRLNSQKVSKTLSSTYGIFRYSPSIPSTSPEHSLLNLSSKHCALK